ncbi:ABC transporter permease [Cesiribacter andamanensis]|uniref:Macrolide export ATP-binding/permease protein MacB n=1 Tax=Cesiribacter andamanensis AMV16 TaxID=1279009 RepID=M7NFV8_9BACT|nr:FtsX-like permease family protein [Cesiribacter andamanensis]EMR00700.1 Macrolide export ATP-binding/permease protein MacB [Cesiribacter andamanensis AMV16]
MWHRKGRNFLLLTEIFFSFLVLFITGTLIIEGLRDYYTPVGFDYSDLYEIDMSRHGEGKASSLAKLQQLRPILASTPEISSYSFSSSNTPFSYSTMNVDMYYEEKMELSHFYRVDPSYFETLDLELLEGRWLQKGDVGSPEPVVINQTLAERYFPQQSALGKRIGQFNDKNNMQVVGVIRNYRQDGEFQAADNALFRFHNEQDTTSEVPGKILLEIKAGADPAWQQQLMERLNKVAGNWTLELAVVTHMRKAKAKMKLIPLIALSIVCGFLVFNVALGLFGVLWYNISKRYAEIGIRRAFGATESSIRWQMLGEVMVLATLGLVLGVLLAVQFPLLGVMNVTTSIYAISIATSLLLIYLLVALCAWYPSKQAAQIEPALALHYE